MSDEKIGAGKLFCSFAEPVANGIIKKTIFARTEEILTTKG